MAFFDGKYTQRDGCSENAILEKIRESPWIDLMRRLQSSDVFGWSLEILNLNR